MRGVHFFCFFLILPALAVLGHDIYLAFFSEDNPLGQYFQFSDLGWLWVQYGPDTYNWAKASVNESLWQNMIEPVLTQTALVVALVPALAIYALLAVCRVTGLWPFSGQGLNLFGRAAKSTGTGLRDAGKKGAMKYKRK